MCSSLTVGNIKYVADWKCVVTVWIAANIKDVADWKRVVIAYEPVCASHVRILYAGR